ncbi:MAG: hypothetical protein JWP63_2665 [Candidatus Solibacter sp.]|jgi:uncharacterized membrane protein HdeD (DUF308 family)|nr:hypothetical protein [Candidatus Solibacter sp.]
MGIALATNWWALVIRGLLGIVLGILTFAWPGITLMALVFLFAGYALADGVMNIIGAVRAIEKHDRWGAQVLEGIVGIAAAVITVLWPGITTLALVYVIAAWALFTGVLKVVAAVRLRRYISGEWLLILSGIASIVLGFLMALVPIAGALVIALWVGAYWFVLGVLFVALGFRMRSWARGTTARGGPIPAPAH